MEEQRLYNDLLVGNFNDNYFNNTYKFIYSIGLARNYCEIRKEVPYLFLVDDDYYVNVKNLVEEVKKHTINERLYMGLRLETTPFRINFQKFTLSLTDYPYNSFPPYNSGGSVLISGQTVKEFYYAIQYIKFFKFDDVYTGILAYLLSINVQNNDKFLYCYSLFNNKCDIEDKNILKNCISLHGFSPFQMEEKHRFLTFKN